MIQNPILRGFHPDPSICRVGEDYYLATSTFSYFPGVPIYHSRDLAHWRRIGHVLERREQLHVTYEDISAGIFAPTLRWHGGTFYLITTNMTTGENFFCTATDPAGPWSDPVVLGGVGGIDPSLFWDEDGKAYYTGTAPWNDPRFPEPCIVCGQINLTTGRLVGELWSIGSGYAKDAPFPERPHLYRKDGWYYLLIAEGGTQHDHAITVSRSRSLREPFEQCPHNPVLTHRHLGKDYPICNVGHGDMVECQDGSWYAVCLGSRLVNGYHKPLGWETFLVPVIWEEGWPVFSPGTGKVEQTYPTPAFATPEAESAPETLDWNYLGTPYENFAHWAEDRVTLDMLPRSLVPWEFEGEHFDFFSYMRRIAKTRSCMPFVGVRLEEAQFTAEVQLRVTPENRESAGLALLQNNANQLRLEVLAGARGRVQVRAVRVCYRLEDGNMHYEETVAGELSLPASGGYTLRITGGDNRYDFDASVAGEPPQTVARQVDGTHLGSETAEGFVGAYVGLFATGNGAESRNQAEFSGFSCRSTAW